MYIMPVAAQGVSSQDMFGSRLPPMPRCARAANTDLCANFGTEARAQAGGYPLYGLTLSTLPNNYCWYWIHR